MNLDDLCEKFDALDFPELGEETHPEEQVVRSARSEVERAIASEKFLVDCLSHEIDLIKQGSMRVGLRPFLVLPETGIRLSFGHWAPGSTPGPHEHNAWTITAVCRNELEVQTFDREKSILAQQLVRKNRFSAFTGMVGFIYHPSIHSPVNKSRTWTLSIHISSPCDGEIVSTQTDNIIGLKSPIADTDIEYNNSYKQVVLLRQQRRYISHIVKVLDTFKDVKEEAIPLIQKCLRMCDLKTTSYLSERFPEFGFDNNCPQHDYYFEKVNKGLSLSYKENDKLAILQAETGKGLNNELIVNSLGADALQYIANNNSFSVADLPGRLTLKEKLAICEGLESAGLYTGFI